MNGLKQSLKHPLRLVTQATLLGLLPLGLGLASCTGQRGGEPMSGDHGMMQEGDHGMMQGMNHDMHDMDLGPADATYDLRFIDAMIIHHEGAVVMAEAALANSQREEIRQLATDIIAAQEQEIAQMQTWRQAWYPDAPADPVMYHAEMNHDMPMSAEMAAAMTMAMDLGPGDEGFDLRFINAMIPHHEGAVVMAEDLQQKSDRAEMQTLATEIIAAQEGEIVQMLAWRRAWYGE
ncbi:DUF305 domain-containing protein [Leptolyngbya sp. PCC 6406]|uniref:DUF305 domain-containing protein n=1 Tax=Leptolyngbya sp. PCC 6406 TaxID=1173264 RepID=UPI0002AD0B91|nr:DUF305 domain-containing protein [Leptolyngbya sp. PCC 6406]